MNSLAPFVEKSKKTVQRVSFGSIENMFQRQMVNMNDEIFSFWWRSFMARFNVFKRSLKNQMVYFMWCPVALSPKKNKTNIHKS